MVRLMKSGMLIAAVLVLLPVAAQAQATRTWVSGVGDDVNPCSRTAPCKTWAGAISKTAAGGEISALDPGGFGAVTITKSITLSGDGTLASILSAGTNGIVISAAATDVVIIRNLSLHGGNTGLNAIRYLAGGAVIVENVTIAGFTGVGVTAQLTASGNLSVRNLSVVGGSSGVRVTTAGGLLRYSVVNSMVRNASKGVYSLQGAIGTVTNSVFASNNQGVLAEGGSIMNVEDSTLSGNTTGAQGETQAIVRLSNSNVFDNTTGFVCGSGTVATAGNNRVAGNGAGCTLTGGLIQTQ
jgi:hypothetical protein